MLYLTIKWGGGRSIRALRVQTSAAQADVSDFVSLIYQNDSQGEIKINFLSAHVLL